MTREQRAMAVRALRAAADRLEAGEVLSYERPATTHRDCEDCREEKDSERIIMINSELDEIIRVHNLWLRGLEGGAKADLRGADLSCMNLSGARLSYADLRGADLSGAILTGANLRRADLSDANLARAVLSCADLSLATLSDAVLISAILDGADLTRANLAGAALSYVNLTGADLSNTDLRGADLSLATLSNTDLSGSVNGPAYYSVSLGGHGEAGRRLHAVELGGRLVFSCGYFSGHESDLRKYIEEGDEHLRVSRLRALKTILEMHEEMK